MGWQAARVRTLQWLAEYTEAGRYPKNRDFPGRRTPYLRDSEGVSCAVAHLLERSGDGGMVDRLSATDNHVVLRDAGTASLQGSFERIGLTAEEAARIQPMYGCDPAPAVAVQIALFSFAFLPLEMTALRVAAMLRPNTEAQWMRAVSYLTLINVAVSGVFAFFLIQLLVPFVR